MKRFAVLFLLAAAMLLLFPTATLGYQSYQDSIPNGAIPKRGGSTCGAVGHADCNGRGTLSVFGQDCKNKNYDWAQICPMDSDGDTFTNGAELGDPNCVWVDFNSVPARTTDITDPGDANSKPSSTSAATPTPATPSPAATGVTIISPLYTVVSGLTVSWYATSTLVYFVIQFPVGAYGAAAVSANGMTGTYVFAHVTGGTTANCKIYTATGYSVSLGDDQTGVAVHASTIANGKANITCRVLRTALGVARNSQQRMIFATAGWTSAPQTHTASGRVSAKVNIDAGTLKTIDFEHFIKGWAVMIALFGAWVVVGFFLRTTNFSVRQTIAVQVAALLSVLLSFLAVFLAYHADYVAIGKMHPVADAFGWAAVGGFAMLILPTTKHAAVHKVIGSAYERTLWLHPVIGIVAFIAATIHMAMFINAGRLLISGLVAYSCFAFMFVTSALRTAHPILYRVFHYTHTYPIIIPTLFFVGRHVQFKFFWAMLPGLLFYGIDLILRVFYFARAEPKLVLLRDLLGNGSVTEVQISAEWSEAPPPGSYCQLSTKLDKYHPFSVARYDPQTKITSFFIKTVGFATQRLADETAAFTSDKAGKSVICFGPYGSPQFNVAQVDTLMFVAGGIGITPIMYAVQWLANTTTPIQLKRVLVVWVLREEAVAAALEPYMREDLARLASSGAVTTELIVSVTTGSTKFSRARPDIGAKAKQLLKEAPQDAKAGIFCCGPEPLMASCTTVATENNFLLHSETFSI